MLNVETDRCLAPDERLPAEPRRWLRVDGRNGGAGGYRTIADALSAAGPGDGIEIAGGVYRECLSPRIGGTPDQPLIIRARAGERVVVSGADVVVGPWQPDPQRPGVWRKVLSADLRGAIDLFTYRAPAYPPRWSLGQVIVDSVPLMKAIDDAELRVGVGLWWFEEDSSTLLVHLQDESVLTRPGAIEVTTRRQWVAPGTSGLGHIQIEGIGFQFAGNSFPHSFWNPVTGVPQMGGISTLAGHHWTIRNCTLKHVRGIGISCGANPLDQNTTDEVPFREVGYHLIENNHITDCGVCGIAGAGHRETVIRYNRIERCNSDGWTSPECGGIKLHFCYDCLIEGNVIRDIEASGIWLDNQWYGSRVTRNVVINTRGQGIFIEMGDGPCLVDHNITAFVRLGDGIYLHDASGVTVAHNLSYCNSHFGLYARVVTERLANDASGQRRRVGCSDLDIRNNLFIDNYRGHVCLPLPSERSNHNRCDYNLYVNGAQWHWEAQPFHQFAVGTNDGRISFEQLRQRIDPTMPDDACTRYTAGVAANGSIAVGADVWRELGWDHCSILSAIPQALVENGAVSRGAVTLSAQALYFRASTGIASIARAEVPAIEHVDGVGDVTHDFLLVPLSRAVYPGPIQNLAGRESGVSLIPASRMYSVDAITRP